MKKRPFKYTKIDLCRNCQGCGVVEAEDFGRMMPVCPVCGGTGRIKKTIEGTVTIEQLPQ